MRAFLQFLVRHSAFSPYTWHSWLLPSDTYTVHRNTSSLLALAFRWTIWKLNLLTSMDAYQLWRCNNKVWRWHKREMNNVIQHANVGVAKARPVETITPPPGFCYVEECIARCNKLSAQHLSFLRISSVRVFVNVSGHEFNPLVQNFASDSSIPVVCDVKVILEPYIHLWASRFSHVLPFLF